MSDGVEVAYDVTGLQAGAADLREVAARGAAAGAALQAAPLASVMFGLTPGAAVFAATVQAARAAQARGFQEEAGRAGGLGARGDATAGLGDDLTARTAATARTSTPGSR